MDQPRAMARVKQALLRNGFGGSARIAAERARRWAYLHEDHVWYELSLDGRSSERPIPDGIELKVAGPDDAAFVAMTGRDPDQVRAWIADGHDLWLMLDDGTVAFSCWVFHGRAPVLAARGGWLTLPRGIVCLEDSVTNPQYRGRGIAPAAWGGIAASLHERGLTCSITKVAVDNAPSRKACLKGGFVEVGTMRMTRVGTRYRVTVEDPRGTTGPLLAAALER